MKKILVAFVLTALPFSLLTQISHAKETESETQTKTNSFRVIHVNDLQQMMKTDAANVHVFDANNDKTRQAEGLIPTASALPSSSHYEVATLPSDKNSKLVFYCANTECMASHDAAKVAMKAGYSNVYVMVDGIQGWKKAGKPTQKFDKKG